MTVECADAVIDDLCQQVDSVFAPDGWLVQQGRLYLPEQADFAQHMVSLITTDPASGFMGLFQGDTGIGKTLAYLFPLAIYAASRHRPVILSTYQISLQQQIMADEWPWVVRWFEAQGRLAPTLAQHLGRQNFVSPGRVERWVSTFFADTPVLPDDWQSLVAWTKAIASGGSGLLADYIERYGRLPSGVRAQDICVNEHSLKDRQDNPMYARHLEQAREADMTLTSHAMVVLEGLKKGSVLNLRERRVGFVMFDEADRLFSACESYSEYHTHPSRIVALLDDVAPHLSRKNELKACKALAADLYRQVSEVSADYAEMVFLDSAKRAHAARMPICDTAEALGKALGRLQLWLDNTGTLDRQPELLDELRDYGLKLDAFNAARPEYGQIRGVSYSPVRKVPSLFMVDPNIGSLGLNFMRQWSKDPNQCRDDWPKIALTSATLANVVRAEQDFTEIRQQLYIPSEWVALTGCFAPLHYGHMSLTLASDQGNKPFDDNQDFETEWLTRSCDMIIEASSKGPVLVLTNSFMETRTLARRLSTRLDSLVVHEHRPGQTAQDLLAAFRSREGVLLTPSMWEGVSIRDAQGDQFLVAVVVTRLPYFPASSAWEAARVGKMVQDGMPYKRAQNLLFMEVTATAVRKLRQGIGRGIRGRHDVIALYIADPRFAKGLGVNRVYAPFLRAIPTRFHPLSNARIWLDGSAGHDVDTDNRLIF